MARFARIDSQIRANCLILANRFTVPELNPFVCESRFGGGGAKIANRRFGAIRANRPETGVFLRIDSRESPRFALRVAGPSKLCDAESLAASEALRREWTLRTDSRQGQLCWKKSPRLEWSLGKGMWQSGNHPGEKRHININILLWLTFRWPWDKRLVVPGLTGSKFEKVYVFTSKHRKYKLFPLVNRRVVPGLSRLSKSLCVQSLCVFFLP